MYGYTVFSKLRIIVLLILIVNTVAWPIDPMDPVVVTKMGPIRGRRSEDGSYFKFMGIPYATINKSNPFGNAEPSAPFEKIFDANEEKVLCPQNDRTFKGTDSGSLDCLRLNIGVPNSALENSLPVLVFIHGGRFAVGYGNHHWWGPKNIIDKDVIFVSINSRLNIYGYLCLNNSEVPGNQGLKDQLLALKWIKDKIESFGGDPERITLMGDSSGAVLADLHAHFDNEKLFNQLMLPGGSMFKTLPFYRRDDTEYLLNVTKVLGFSTNNTSEALFYLTTVEPQLVAAAACGLIYALNVAINPCVEKNASNTETFIKNDPIFEVPNVKGMAVMTVLGSDAARFRHAKNELDSYKNWNGFYNFLKTNFAFNEMELECFEAAVRTFYIGDKNISYEEQNKLINFESDVIYYYPMHRLLNKYIDSGAEKVYHSVFSYNGSRNLVKYLYGNNAGGAAHGDFLGYLFDSPQLPKPTSEDQLIIERITTMWTNFIKYGDPTPQTSELLPVRWTPITKGSPKFYLNIDTAMTLGTSPFRERMAFWDTFYKTNGNFEKGYLHKNITGNLTSTCLHRNSTTVFDRIPLSSKTNGICPNCSLYLFICISYSLFYIHIII